MYSRQILSNNRGSLGCLVGFVVTFVLIIATVGGVFGYFWNATPEKLNIADTKLINDQTFRSLGFADTPFKDIYKQLRALVKNDNSNIVTNSPTDADKTSAESNLDNTSSLDDGEGNIDYTLLLTTQTEYDGQYLLSYDDTTLAYIFNQVVEGSIENASNSSAGGVEYMKKIGAQVNEITITRETAAESADLRIVMSINSAGLKDQIRNSIGGALANILPIPDVIYLVAYYSLTPDEANNRKLACESVNLKINDTENAVSAAIFTLLASQTGGETSDMTESEKKAVVNDKIGDAFVGIVYNLGNLGTAAVVPGTNQVSTGYPILYGDGGLQNGKITVITRMAL